MTHDLTTAIAERLRHLRTDAGLTLDELASAARGCGLGWARPTLSQIESGNRRVAADELFALPLVLHRCGIETNVLDLIGDSPVELTDKYEVTAKGFQALAGGTVGGTKGVRWRSEIAEPIAEALASTLASAASAATAVPAETTVGDLEHAEKEEACQKAAARLGRDPGEVAVASFILWGRSLTTEREARLGSETEADEASRRARRGHVTRALLAELRTHFETAEGAS